MTTLEQVEKLRTLANVSYDEAKAALDASNGDLLEAIIELEKQGKITAPTGGGYYSSEKIAGAGFEACKAKCWEKQTKYGNCGDTFMSLMKKSGRFCLKMIRKGSTNHFEVLKDGESKASFPVIVLTLLLIFAFWVTIPLVIIGLFFGLRYRFHGPDFNNNTVNDAMNSAADAVVNLKKSTDN